MKKDPLDKFFEEGRLERIVWKKFKSRLAAQRALNGYVRKVSKMHLIAPYPSTVISMCIGDGTYDLWLEEEPNTEPGKPPVWRVRVC